MLHGKSMASDRAREEFDALTCCWTSLREASHWMKQWRVQLRQHNCCPFASWLKIRIPRRVPYNYRPCSSKHWRKLCGCTISMITFWYLWISSDFWSHSQTKVHGSSCSSIASANCDACQNLNKWVDGSLSVNMELGLQIRKATCKTWISVLSRKSDSCEFLQELLIRAFSLVSWGYFHYIHLHIKSKNASWEN